jgi:DNA-binding IclR family transcriptional regulator
MTDDDVSEEEWRELASIRHSVRGTRKQDILEIFPDDQRTTLSPSEIAEQLDMSLSNVSRELQKLVELGLVVDLVEDKPNYKPYAITEKGMNIREMLGRNQNTRNTNYD